MQAATNIIPAHEPGDSTRARAHPLQCPVVPRSRSSVVSRIGGAAQREPPRGRVGGRSGLCELARRGLAAPAERMRPAAARLHRGHLARIRLDHRLRGVLQWLQAAPRSRWWAHQFRARGFGALCPRVVGGGFLSSDRKQCRRPGPARTCAGGRARPWRVLRDVQVPFPSLRATSAGRIRCGLPRDPG